MRNDRTFFVHPQERGEVVVVGPSGHIVFLGFWGLVRLIVWAIWNGYKVEVVKDAR